ncbi:hypothetical protein FHR58_000998 [Xanthomonas arboricola]|nr:hypothetical protein [Xanthomonas arboricola]
MQTMHSRHCDAALCGHAQSWPVICSAVATARKYAQRQALSGALNRRNTNLIF